MPNLSLSTFMGTPEPEASPFGRASGLFAARPTTGEVIGAFVEETFAGEGSLAQDIQASNVEKQERRGKRLSEDEWKTSDSFRQGLIYHDTMTESSAKTLADIQDDRQERQLVMSKATGLQTVAGFGVGFLSGVVEPKNLLSGVAAALITGGAGIIIPSIGRTIAVNTVRGAVVRGGAEGVVAAALTEPSNIESSKIVQGDYTMADSILNITLGAILGAGIGGGVKKIQLRGEAKVTAREAELAEAYKAETQGLAVKEFDTALGQTVQGAAVDVKAVRQIDNAEISTKARQKLRDAEDTIEPQELDNTIRDASLEVDQAPIRTLQNDISKNDNSTAYDPRSSEAIAKELEEFAELDEQIQLEREFEGMQEQIAELNEQGLLNEAEIRTIGKLAEIETESVIFDNVLLSVQTCLTRG